jgi:hypothetical protein
MMVLNPEVHLYDNIRNAKDSHLLICHYTFVETTPKHVGPRGVNCQPELPQTKDITASIITNKTTVFMLHGQRGSNGKEIPVHKHILLHSAYG